MGVEHRHNRPTQEGAGMSLCKLLVLDFTDQTGRFDERNEERYGVMDLQFGIGYAEGLIEDGYNTEPFYQFNLKRFARWCSQKLQKEASHEH